MNIKDLYFKVKKIEVMSGVSRIGVLAPIFEDNSQRWMNPTVSFNETKLNAILSDGTSMIVSAGSKTLKNTRITDEKTKGIIDEIIEIEKKKYKNNLYFIKAFNDYHKAIELYNNTKTSLNNSSTIASTKWAKDSGYLEGENFLREINNLIKNPTKGYSIELTTVGSLVTGFKLEKEHDLGKWLNNGSYDFIYLEYDDNVMIDENIEDSKDFKEIKRKYFSDVKSGKVNGATLVSNYDADGGGDKRSAVAYHTITIDFPKHIEKTSENLAKIADTINATLKLL